jgi:hypothetical protein
MMKKILLISLILVFFSQISFASTDTVKFAVIRVDYLTYSLKDIYFFQQPYQISIPAEHEQIYHSPYVRFNPAVDFGGTTIRNANMGMVIYEVKAPNEDSGWIVHLQIGMELMMEEI